MLLYNTYLYIVPAFTIVTVSCEYNLKIDYQMSMKSVMLSLLICNGLKVETRIVVTCTYLSVHVRCILILCVLFFNRSFWNNSNSFLNFVINDFIKHSSVFFKTNNYKWKGFWILNKNIKSVLYWTMKGRGDVEFAITKV